MDRDSRTIRLGVQAALFVAVSGWAGVVYGDPLITFLDSEASVILDSGQVNLHTDGTVAGALAGPCASACSLIPTPLGPDALSYTSGNRNGQVSGNASVNLGGISSGQASATLPTTSMPVGANGWALSNTSATATSLGITGSFAAAAAGGWDTLTFQGAGAGATGTLSLTLTLDTQGKFIDVGTGGGCLSVGAACNPFSNMITGGGATETLTKTISLNQPLLVFDALYVVADNDPNVQTTEIDPAMIIDLPAGVTFTTVSGNSGGTGSGPPPPGVPEPGSMALFGAGGIALAAWLRRRKRGAD